MTTMNDADGASEFDLEAGDDGADAFLKSFEEADKRREEAPEAPEGEAEAAAPEAEEQPSSEAEEPEVELPFGEEVKKFKLSDVRSAIEAREQHAKVTAEAQQAVQAAAAQSERAQTALTKMLDRAKAAYAPYANVDWLALSRDPSIDHASFVAVREEAQKLADDLRFLETELDAEVGRSRQAAQVSQKEAAEACIKELIDPEKGIKGFGPALYAEMMQFATERGLPGMRTLTSPAALKLLHNAMLYERGQTKTAAQVTKVVKQPTKVIRPAGSRAGGEPSKLSTAMAALRASGSVDAATAAFEAHLNG